MSSTALLRFSSCMGSFCWLRAFTQPVQSKSCTASSRPPSVDAASAEWYAQTTRFLNTERFTMFHRDFTLQHKDRWRTSFQEQSVVVVVTDDVGLVPSLCPQFVFLTYILGVAWLGVFGFSAVPVFLFYNMWSTCATMRSPMANLTNIDSICVDVRQYGKRECRASFGSRQMASLQNIALSSDLFRSWV